MENLYFVGMLLVGMLIGTVFGIGGLAVGYYFYKNMYGNKSKLFASFDEIAEREENNNE